MKVFLSLKWKIFIVSFFLLTNIFVGRTFYAYWFFQTQINEQREQRLARNKIIWSASLKKSFHDLERRISAIPSLEGMTKALFETNAEKSKKLTEAALANYWWELEIQMGLAGLVVFNNLGQSIVGFGVQEMPADIVTQSKNSNASQFVIACYQDCYIYVATELLIEGVNIGTAVATINFSDAALQFRDISGDNVAVIRPAPGDKSNDRRLNNWNSHIIAITDSKKLIPLLQEFSQNHSKETLTGALAVFPWEESHYDLASISMSPNHQEKFPQAIIVSDITQLNRAFEEMFRQSVLYDGLGIILMAVCLWLVLLKPVNRLQQVTKQIPDLANNAFQQVRNALRESEDRFGILDESNQLSVHAVELSHRLEAMQNQIKERNAELEFQSTELQKERDFATALLNTANAVIVMHDHAGRITLVNQYTCDLTGYDHNELIGKKFTALFPPGHLPGQFHEQMEGLMTGKTDVYQHEADMTCKQGQLLHMTWYYSAIPDPTTSFNNILTVALDISARKKAEDHLGWLASHDTLTSLCNRRHFHEVLENTLKQCHRMHWQAALFFVDLDHFKDVNDTSGHHVGDELLKKVSGALKEQTRDSDVVARFGGDEFAILLQNTTRHTAETVAKRICTSISSITVRGENHEHHGSCSVGVVVFPRSDNPQDTIVTLMGDADIAMYHAKKTGRNNWCFFEDSLLTKEEAKERMYWDQLVKSSLEKDLIVLYFQPIMQIKQRQTTHYECLLRVREGNKIVPPIHFVKAAEESGLMSRVDEHVISLAFQYKKLMEMSQISCSISINLSGLSFQNSNLLFHIQHCLDEYQINPREIIFEITETSAVFDIRTSKKLMLNLKNMGFYFALDDFGAGFSTLAYLKQFPIDFIKIDGEFIKNIDTDLEDQILVKSIIDTAAAFKIKTIAEFVENEASLLLLESLGVDYGQGYYIDKPKPFEEIWDLQVGDGVAYSQPKSPGRPATPNSP